MFVLHHHYIIASVSCSYSNNTIKPRATCYYTATCMHGVTNISAEDSTNDPNDNGYTTENCVFFLTAANLTLYDFIVHIYGRL